MIFPFWWPKWCPCKNNYTVILLKNGKEINRKHLLVGDHMSILIEHAPDCHESKEKLDNHIELK